MDGRTKDWWIGYLLGVLGAISLSGSNGSETARKALVDFKDWESKNHGSENPIQK